LPEQPVQDIRHPFGFAPHGFRRQRVIAHGSRRSRARNQIPAKRQFPVTNDPFQLMYRPRGNTNSNFTKSRVFFLFLQSMTLLP
jgi:hypothetical protein